MNALLDYHDRLTRHDWFYAYSDDSSVYKRGEAAQKLLSQESLTSPQHRELYTGFQAHHFSGKPWGTEKEPMPADPAKGATA